MSDLPEAPSLALPAAGSPAGWYPVGGGKVRYWDGSYWEGYPLKPSSLKPRKINLGLATFFSLLIWPAGFVCGAMLLRRGRKSGWVFIGIATFYTIAFVGDRLGFRV